MLVYPCEEADLPSKQLEDLRRLETALKETFIIHKKAESKYRALFGALVLVSLLCLWHDYQTYSGTAHDERINILLIFGPFIICVCVILLFLSSASCREKLKEGREYLRRMNKVLKTLHLYFDSRTSKLNVLVEKQFGSSFELK